MKKLFTVFGLIFVTASFAYAGSPDAASATALSETQSLLQNPDQRNKVITNSADAQTVDAQVKALTGNSQASEELYSLSGKVLEDLVKETGGDPVKMLEIMSKAQADPKSLMDHLSDQNKKEIHAVSSEIKNSPTTARKPASQN